MNRSYHFFVSSMLCLMVSYLTSCQSSDQVPTEVAASIAGYPTGIVIPETDFTVINQWETVHQLTLLNNQQDVVLGQNTTRHTAYAVADSNFRIAADKDFELRVKLLSLGTQTSAYNTDLVLGLDDDQQIKSSPKMDAQIRILRIWDRAQHSIGLDQSKSGVIRIPNTPLAVGDAVFMRRTESDVTANTTWEFGVIRSTGTEEILGEAKGFNFVGDARPKVSLALTSMRAQVLLVTENSTSTPTPAPTPPPTPTPTPPTPTPNPSPTPPSTPPTGTTAIIDQWEKVYLGITRDQGKTLYRYNGQEVPDHYALADASYDIAPTQDFELRATFLGMGRQAQAYDTDLILGLDDASNIKRSAQLDAFVSLAGNVDQFTSTTDNVSGQARSNTHNPSFPLTVGDEIFIRRVNAQTPSQTTWECGYYLAANGAEFITGSGIGFNFSGDARPKVSIGSFGMSIQVSLTLGSSPTPPQSPPTTPSPTPPTPTPSPTPPPTGGQSYVMRNATNSLNFSGWEHFDPAIRNYNPQSTRINTYFRTRISGLNTSTSGIEWSSDIPPLIPGDGQVMKSWTTLQNPSSFTAGTTPRAELEAHDYIKQLGWSVYDPAIPQTRAYSFAFRLPTNFTYSTTGGGSPGAISNDGYNWIISQWHDYGSPVTPPYAIHMRGKDILFREKIYNNWYTIVSDADQEFNQGKWIVFLIIAKWTTANDGYFKLFYDWADPANPMPTNWKLAINNTGKATIHPQANRDVTAAWRIGGYWWVLNNASVNSIWWNNNAGVNRQMVAYYDQWRAIRLDDPRFSTFSEADIKRYFELLTQ